MTDPAGRPPFDHRPLALEDLGGRRGERLVADVPAPGADGAAQPDGLEPGDDPVGVGHGAGLDDGGHAVLRRLQGGERRRDLVVVAGVGTVQRHRPLEDRCARRQQVGDAAADQRVAGEVLVGVDHARRHDAAAGVEHLRIGVGPPQFRRRADGLDDPVVDEHGAADEHLTCRIHGDDVAAGDQQRRHRHPPSRSDLRRLDVMHAAAHGFRAWSNLRRTNGLTISPAEVRAAWTNKGQHHDEAGGPLGHRAGRRDAGRGGVRWRR